jgi:hypothetical protein
LNQRRFTSSAASGQRPFRSGLRKLTSARNKWNKGVDFRGGRRRKKRRFLTPTKVFRFFRTRMSYPFRRGQLAKQALFRRQFLLRKLSRGGRCSRIYRGRSLRKAFADGRVKSLSLRRVSVGLRPLFKNAAAGLVIAKNGVPAFASVVYARLKRLSTLLRRRRGFVRHKVLRVLRSKVEFRRRCVYNPVVFFSRVRPTPRWKNSN